MPTEPKYRKVCLKVAARLKKERELRGVSMTVLGDRAGLSQQSVSYIERGMRIPNLDTLLRIADALGIELSKVIEDAVSDSESRKA